MYCWSGCPVNKNITVKNSGTIVSETETLTGRADYVYIENKKGAVIGSSAAGGMGNQQPIGIKGFEAVYVKNDGIIQNNDKLSVDDTGSITSNKKLAVVNNGTIRNISNDSKIGWPPSKARPHNESDNISFRANDIYVLNNETGVIESVINNKAGRSGTALRVASYGDKKGIFKNKGIVRNKDKSKWRYAISSQNMYIDATEGKIDGNVYLDSKNTLDFEGNEIDGNIELDGHDNELKINEKSTVTGTVKSYSNTNNTLTVSKGIKNIEKYKGFDHLNINDAEINTEDDGEILTFTETVNINENSKVNLTTNKLRTRKLTNKGEIVVKQDFILYGNLKNENAIKFEDKSPTKTLTIDENYEGTGSILLNIDNEKNDKVNIEGDATGETTLKLNNKISKKIDDRLLIETNSSTDSAFKLGSKSKAKGIFLYLLEKRNENNKDNWYLVQNINSIVGSYASVGSAANNIFNLRLEDRISKIEKDRNNLWIRTNYTKVNSSMEKLPLDMSSHRFAIQTGKDVYEYKTNKIKGLVGVMGAYGLEKGQTTTKPVEKETTSPYMTNAISAGVYTNLETDFGFNLDAWGAYVLGFNKLEDKDMLLSHGPMLSLELGQEISFDDILFVTPQLQLTYQGVMTKDLVVEGTTIKNLGQHNLQTRVGTKIAFKAPNVTPYVEVNYINNLKPAGVEIEGEKYYISGNRHMGEIKAGLDNININDRLKMWGNITTRFNPVYYMENKVELGLKYNF
ncbi:MAG: autotransporter outer membrane beta-barrel domain-containing protein [Oceanivirga sp.]|nr:autotransporter outer membrane beta-barrel domain-containing protein [Oceanivirga sp.]